MNRYSRLFVIVFAVCLQAGCQNEGPTLTFEEGEPNIEELEASLPEGEDADLTTALMEIGIIKRWAEQDECPSMMALAYALAEGAREMEGKTARYIIEERQELEADYQEMNEEC